MYRFLKNGFLMSVPALLWILFIFMVDPFRYFGASAWIEDETKIKNAAALNGFMHKIITYHNDPGPYILVGDSRTDCLSLDEIERVEGIRYKKLSIPAAKLNEVADAIYYAHEKNALKHVVVGINLTMFNEYGYADRVRPTQKLLENPLRYIFNRPVAEAAFYVLRGHFAGVHVNKTPQRTPEEQWEQDMKIKTKHWYGRYKYPPRLEKQIREVDDFAKEQGIRLTFIVVPHHVDFRQALYTYGLEEDEKRFLTFLSSLHAQVVSYDFSNEITRKRESYKDPVHYTDDVGNLIIQEVWKGPVRVGRTLD